MWTAEIRPAGRGFSSPESAAISAIAVWEKNLISALWPPPFHSLFVLVWCVYVCVCESQEEKDSEKEKERVNVCVFPCVCAGVSVSVCVCVCMKKKEMGAGGWGWDEVC